MRDPLELQHSDVKEISAVNDGRSANDADNPAAAIGGEHRKRRVQPDRLLDQRDRNRRELNHPVGNRA